MRLPLLPLLLAASLAAPAYSQDIGILHGEWTSANAYNDVKAKLDGTGLLNSTTLYQSITVMTPTLADLQVYDAVLIWSNFDFFDSVALGDVLADYVDAGGGVVVMTFGNAEPNLRRHLRGRWETGGYDLIAPTGITSGAAGLGTVLDPLHPIMQGVNTFTAGSAGFRCTGAPAAHANIVAQWNDGLPLVVASTQFANRADLCFWPPSSSIGSTSWDANTDGALLMANALVYVSNLGQLLTVSPMTAGASATITVQNVTPFGVVRLGVSLAGNGPLNVNLGGCGLQSFELSPPVTLLPTMNTDASGGATLTVNVPAGLAGATVWFHGIDFTSCRMLNSLSMTVL